LGELYLKLCDFQPNRFCAFSMSRSRSTFFVSECTLWDHVGSYFA